MNLPPATCPTYPPSKIEKDHTATANREIQSRALRNNLICRIQAECAAVARSLDTAYILGEVSNYFQGKISAGEKLSCRHMVALLQDHGLKAAYIDLSKIIDLSTN